MQLFNDIKCFNSERSDKLKSYELTEEMFNKKYDKYSALIYRLAFQYTLSHGGGYNARCFYKIVRQ